MRGSGGVICDERCGCPSPCPGGVACRCKSGGMGMSGGGGGGEGEHKRYSCGEHCGCNPCTTCSKATPSEGTGKAFCNCSQGCTCVTCSS